MNCVSHDLPPSPAYPARAYTFAALRSPVFDGVLIVQLEHSGRTSSLDVYAVCEMPPDSPDYIMSHNRYFVLAKCGPATDEREGLYLVTVARSQLQDSYCQCFGFNRWGACKHQAALTDLVRREEI